MVGPTAFQQLFGMAGGGGSGAVINNQASAPDASGVSPLTTDPRVPNTGLQSLGGVRPMPSPGVHPMAPLTAPSPGVPSTPLQSLFGGTGFLHTPITAYRAFRG